jgi:hypothetical protein
VANTFVVIEKKEESNGSDTDYPAGFTFPAIE